MKTATRDKYDEEVERLVGVDGDELYEWWVHAHSPLFSFLSRSRGMESSTCGCPSMVRTANYAATKDSLTSIIRGRQCAGLPEDMRRFCMSKWPHLDEPARRKTISLFARAQRLADEMIPGRVAP